MPVLIPSSTQLRRTLLLIPSPTRTHRGSPHGKAIRHRPTARSTSGVPPPPSYGSNVVLTHIHNRLSTSPWMLYFTQPQLVPHHANRAAHARLARLQSPFSCFATVSALPARETENASYMFQPCMVLGSVARLGRPFARTQLQPRLFMNTCVFSTHAAIPPSSASLPCCRVCTLHTTPCAQDEAIMHGRG